MQLTILKRPDMWGEVFTYQFLYPPDERGRIFIAQFHYSAKSKVWKDEKMVSPPVVALRKLLRATTKVVRHV